MKSRRAKLEEQKMLAFGRGFFVLLCRPKGLRAPWNPRQGCPLHRMPISAFGGPCRGPFAEGQGCRGKSAPDTLPAGLGRSGRVKAVSSPLRGCGPHQPLDPPFTENAPEARAGA